MASRATPTKGATRTTPTPGKQTPTPVANVAPASSIAPTANSSSIPSNPSLAAAHALAAAATQFAQSQSSTTTTPSTTTKSMPLRSNGVLPPTSNSKQLLPYSLLTKEEQKTFQMKFRTAQKSPHLVGIQIKALDGLIAFLKQKRATAGQIIANSLAELKQIAKEEDALHLRYDPLEARIQMNMARRDALLRAKSDADAHLNAVMAHTSNVVSKTQHAIDSFKQKQLKADMAFARGLPIPTTTTTTTTTTNPTSSTMTPNQTHSTNNKSNTLKTRTRTQGKL